MPGLPGAIEKVMIRDDGRVETQVIGDVPPEGICGSGMIELLSELLRTERMNSLGRFESDGEILLASNGNGKISFSESDVNELAREIVAVPDRARPDDR